MSKSLLSVLIFLMLFSPFHSHAMDSLVDSQTLECALNLVSEVYPLFGGSVISMFRPSIIFLRGFSRPRREILPLIPAVPALNSIRMALNSGIRTEEIRYVSLSIKESDGNKYLAYGRITKIISSPPRQDTKDIKVYIELLSGEEVTLTGSDLYGIGVSERSKRAFEQVSEGDILPRMRVGERVLVPHPLGGFSYGRVEEFIGDQVEIYFQNSRSREFVPIESIRFVL